jgi:hypothetical protein
MNTQSEGHSLSRKPRDRPLCTHIDIQAKEDR